MISWTAVGLIASIAVVFGFGRDLFRIFVDKRKRFISDEQSEIMRPLEVHGIVLKDTKDAIAIQSTLLVELRAAISDIDKRRIQAETERDALALRVKEADEEKNRLLIQLGQAYGQSFSQRNSGQPPNAV